MKKKIFILLSSQAKSTSGMDKIPMQDEYENALKGNTDLNTKTVKLGELNELTYEDFILSSNTSSPVEKVAFGLVRM